LNQLPTGDTGIVVDSSGCYPAAGR